MDSIGDVMVDGTLRVEQIDLGGGVYQPQFGDAFVIITAVGDLTGEFDTLDAVNLDPIFVYEVFYDYDTDVVTLGVDTFFDADFDFDGAVDGDDFLVWQNQFGASVGGPGSGASAVPEPTPLALLIGFALAGILVRRRFDKPVGDTAG